MHVCEIVESFYLLFVCFFSLKLFSQRNPQHFLLRFLFESMFPGSKVDDVMLPSLIFLICLHCIIALTPTFCLTEKTSTSGPLPSAAA